MLPSRAQPIFSWPTFGFPVWPAAGGIVLAVTLGTLTGTATGTVAVSGQSSQDLAALVSTSAGAVAVTGAGSINLGVLTGTGTIGADIRALPSIDIQSPAYATSGLSAGGAATSSISLTL